ncbi:trans-aconitate methyltransferase 1 [Dipsacomyces acuminosporus]|nr:trans-aconitate methyltransferase 1 [Dipsacomyces acuminosporus]
MATYSQAAFDSSNYNTNRPRYKGTLSDTIVSFHLQTPGAATELAVDVATGTGIFARQLQGKFTKVIGTDISATMLQSARAANKDGASQIEFVQSPAEDLSFLADHSADVITVATGAHWFNIDKFLAEARRVLKPTGTLAIFGYTGFAHFVDYPQCDAIYKEFGIGEEKLGGFWDKGREVLVEGYRMYMPSLVSSKWQGIERRIYPDTIEGEPSTDYPPVVASAPAVMEYSATWRTLEEFISTWSAPVNYHKQYPDRENINDAVIRDLMAAAGATNKDESLRLEWEEVLLMSHAPAQL